MKPTVRVNTTETSSSAAAGTVQIAAPTSARRDPACNMFTALARGNELILIPLNDVARLLLSQWLGARVQMTAAYQGMEKARLFRHGAGMSEAVLTFTHEPMLSSGDDPFYTGMRLLPEEFEVARQAVERYRRRHRIGQPPARKRKK